MAKRRRAHSRRGTTGQGGAAGAVGIVLLAAAVLYILLAGSLGTWLAENLFGRSAAPSETPAPEDTDGDFSSGISETIETPALRIYALQLGAFDSLENAEAFAESSASIDGAGYIYSDSGPYRVLGMGYEKIDEAEETKRRLSEENGLECSIYTITVPAVKLDVSASSGCVDTLGEAYRTWAGSVSHLYELSRDFDAGRADGNAAAEILEEIETGLRKSASAVRREASAGGDTDFMERLASDMEKTADEVRAAKDSGSYGLSRGIKYAYLASAGRYVAHIDGLSTL